MEVTKLLIILLISMLGLSQSTTEDDRFICVETETCSYNRNRLLSDVKTNINLKNFYSISTVNQDGNKFEFKTIIEKKTEFTIPHVDLLDGLSNFKIISAKKDNEDIDFSLKTTFPESVILADSQQIGQNSNKLHIDYKTEGIALESRKVDKIDRDVDKFVSFGYVTFFLSERKVYSTRLGEENVKYQLFSENAFFEAPEDMENLFNVADIFRVKTPPNTMDIFGVLTTEKKLHLFETRGSFKEFSVKFMFYFELSTISPSVVKKVLFDTTGLNIILETADRIIVFYPREPANSKQLNNPTNFRLVSTIYSKNVQASDTIKPPTNVEDRSELETPDEQFNGKSWRIEFDIVDTDVMPDRIYIIAAEIGVYEYSIRFNKLILLYRHTLLKQIQISWNKQVEVSVLTLLVRQDRTKNVYEMLIEFIFHGDLIKFSKAYHSHKFTEISQMVVNDGMVLLAEREYDSVIMFRSGLVPGVPEQVYQLKARYDLTSSSDGPIPVLNSDGSYSYAFNETDFIYQLNEIKHRNEYLEITFDDPGKYEIEFLSYQEDCTNKRRSHNICEIKNTMEFEVESEDPLTPVGCTPNVDCPNDPDPADAIIETCGFGNDGNKFNACCTTNLQTCSTNTSDISNVCLTTDGISCKSGALQVKGNCGSNNCQKCAKKGIMVCISNPSKESPTSTAFITINMLLALLIVLTML